MKDYVYLALVEVGCEPYLIQAQKQIPEGGFVEFYEGPALLLGRVMKTAFVGTEEDTYEMFLELRPVFDAEAVYGSLWRRGEEEAGDG